MILQSGREILRLAAASHCQPIRNAVQLRHRPKRGLPLFVQLEGDDLRLRNPQGQADRVVPLGRADIDEEFRLSSADPLDLACQLALVGAEQLRNEAAADGRVDIAHASERPGTHPPSRPSLCEMVEVADRAVADRHRAAERSSDP
jgi:hypothetical protein